MDLLLLLCIGNADSTSLGRKRFHRSARSCGAPTLEAGVALIFHHRKGHLRLASFPALPVRTAIDSSAGARMRTSAVTNRPESASDSFRNCRTGPLPRAWRDLGEIGSNCSAPRPVIHPIDRRLSQDRSNHGNPRKPTRVSTAYHVARSSGRRRAVNIVEGGAPFRQTSDDDRPQELHCPGRVSAANASPSRKRTWGGIFLTGVE
jgi:hypothetical protein